MAGGAIFLSMYEYSGGGQTGVNSFITIRNNTVRDVYGKDREAITSDGGFSSYLGTVDIVDDSGLQLTLTADPVYVLDPTNGMAMVHEDCVGIAVYVMHGPGAGQWRRVTANAGRAWAIEAPFDVPLVPGRSVLNIASLRAYHIWEGPPVHVVLLPFVRAVSNTKGAAGREHNRRRRRRAGLRFARGLCDCAQPHHPLAGF